jgi:hypothetical protein
MSLVNLKTDLTSLKFGKDRPGGGSSNQPYIKKPLNIDLPPAFDFLGNDFLLRGGPVGAPLATVNDVARLTKYFTDFKNPSGLLFAAKQNLLSRTAVKTQTSGLLNEGIYTPLSTLAQVGVSAFGLHVNKQGLNPFEETGAYATNNENLYAVKVSQTSGVNSENNRLVGYYDKFIVPIKTSAPGASLSSQDFVILDSYSGGPGSDLGIGKTNIYLIPDYRTGINNIKLRNSGFFVRERKSTPATSNNLLLTDPSGKPLSNPSLEDEVNFLPNTFEDVPFNYSVFKNHPQNSQIVINGNKLLGLSNQYLNLNSPINTGFTINGGIDGDIRDVGQLQLPDSTLSSFTNPDLTTSQGVFTYTQKDLNSIEPIGRTGTTTPGDFRAKLRNISTQDKTKEIGNLADAPNYISQSIENRVKLGDPGNRNGKNLNSYVSGAFVPGSSTPSGAASSNSYDKINASKIYPVDGLNGEADFTGEKNDLVKFAISVIDTKTTNVKNIHFRAFLNQISDQYTSDWDPTQYIGRGEKFYTYKGFDRKVSLSWTVVAQSKAELIPMYKKLNYLASICAPNYSGNGYMTGNIVRLTIGGYLYQQPGIITGFSYEMNEDNATWEIGINEKGGFDSSVKELPHLIKVTGFNFTPIHEFVPKLAGNPNFGTKEKFIALATNGNNNYATSIN